MSGLLWGLFVCEPFSNLYVDDGSVHYKMLWSAVTTSTVNTNGGAGGWADLAGWEPDIIRMLVLVRVAMLARMAGQTLERVDRARAARCGGYGQNGSSASNGNAGANGSRTNGAAVRRLCWDSGCGDRGTLLPQSQTMEQSQAVKFEPHL